MEYVTIDNGHISGHFDSTTIPLEGKSVPDTFTGKVGDDERMYDWENNALRLSDEALIALGLIEDNRGTWYVCADQGMFEITEIGVKLPEGIEVTQEVPQSTFDEWDGNQWVLNSIVESAWLKQRAIDTKQGIVDKQLAFTTDAVIRWLETRFTIPQADYDYIDNVTDIAGIKIAMKGILDKLNLDAGDLEFISNWKIKYDAWIAEQE